jgi:hypothetical protein
VFLPHHPAPGWSRSGRKNYHQTELVREERDWDGHPVTSTLFRRPLSATFGDLRAGGSAVDVVDEPVPEVLPLDLEDRCELR